MENMTWESRLVAAMQAIFAPGVNPDVIESRIVHQSGKMREFVVTVTRRYFVFTVGLILLLSAALPCLASWEFEEGAEYVYLGDDAKLTIPDADFTVGGWFKLDGITDSTVHLRWNFGHTLYHLKGIH
jgi:hypothetical protein